MSSQPGPGSIAVRQSEDAAICRATLERVVESNADAIVVVGLDQRIHYTNPAAEALFGRTRAELVGGPFGLPLVPDETTEINVVRSDGHELVAEMRAVEMDWLGHPAFVVSLRDMTLRKQLENELRQAHKMEALGNLAGGIAHEFNNLLTAILFSSGCLVEHLPPTDRRHRYASQIRTVANRAAALTGQLLTFSRKRNVKPALIDLNEVVSDMAALLTQVLGKRICLETVTAPGPATVWIDRGQIEQVIINLAVNARDAMPEGGTLEYQVECVDVEAPSGHGQPDRLVALTVRDSGCGMPPEVQARVFEPFFTTKEEGHGTGLGLSTVHGIVHQAGGRIFVQSHLGSGTTFRVLLPCRERVAAGLGAPRGDIGGDGNPRILVVDDDNAVRDVVVELLADSGYDVQSASDGTEALQLVHRMDRRFHLVVTDLVMPGGTGGQLADDIRQRFPELPILFVSGHARDGLPEHYRHDPLSAFLGKPFTSGELTQHVEQLLAAAAGHADDRQQARA